MSKLFGKILSKKVKAILISCFVGVAVAAGGITTAVVLSNNKGVTPPEIADAVDGTVQTEYTIGAGTDKSTTWSTAVSTSRTYAIPVTVTLTEDWVAQLNSKGTYKIFGTTQLTGFDVRGALEVPEGANIILNLGGYKLDRGLVDEANANANRAVIAGSVIINKGTLNISNGTVQHGYSSTNGGGIYSYGQLTLGKNLTVRANYADLNGGGVYCESDLVVLGTATEPVKITGNYANRMNTAFTGWGGGIHVEGGIATIEYLTATNNQAARGGAVAFYGAGTAFTIKNSTFDANTAYADNQKDFNADGGAICVASTANVAGAVNLIENCEIGTTYGNTATRNGGGIAYWGQNDVDIKYTNFRNNTSNNSLYASSGSGGAIFKNGSSTLNIIGHNGAGAQANYISGNSSFNGGGLCTFGGTTNITGRMIFEENKFGAELTSFVAARGGHVYSGSTTYLNIGTKIAAGATHPANDYQPQFLRNGFVENANTYMYGGAIACGNMNLYGGTIDQCKATRGGAICAESNYQALFDFTISRCAIAKYNDEGNAITVETSIYSHYGDAIYYMSMQIHGGKIINCGDDNEVTGIENSGGSYGPEENLYTYNIIDGGLIYGNYLSISKCEISNNSGYNLIRTGQAPSQLGSKTDSSAASQAKVKITNNTLKRFLFATYLNVYACTISGNTAKGLGYATGVQFYNGCKLSANRIESVYSGSFHNIDFDSWLSDNGISPSARYLFQYAVYLYDCTISNLSYDCLLNYGVECSFIMSNSTISNCTFTQTIFSCGKIPDTSAKSSSYLYLRGNAKIINNKVNTEGNTSIKGITYQRISNGTYNWRVYIQGANNVIKGNVDDSGNSANFAHCFNNDEIAPGVYIEGQLGKGNEIYISQKLTQATTANYSKYAYVDGEFIQPSSFIKFDGDAASYSAYLLDDVLNVGASNPEMDNYTLVSGLLKANGHTTMQFTMRADGNWALTGQYITNSFNSSLIEVAGYTYAAMTDQATGGPSSPVTGTKRTYTQFIDGFVENVVIRTNADGTTTNQIRAYCPGTYVVTFRVKDADKTRISYNGSFYTTANQTAHLNRAGVVNTGATERLGYETSETIKFTPGQTLANSGKYYKYNQYALTRYYTDPERTIEVSKDSIATPGTYYLSISPNYVNRQVYCNYYGDGYVMKNGAFIFSWYPSNYSWHLGSSYVPPNPSNPWQPTLIIEKGDFSASCSVTAPENTIVTTGSTINPYDKIEVWEGSGATARKLVRGTDYNITFSGNTNITEAKMVTATVTPLKNYTGTITKEFAVSVSGTPKILGEPSVSTVTKQYDGTDKFTGTISKDTLMVVNASNEEYDEELLSISTIKAKYSQSGVGQCSLIVTLTFVGNIQSQYNVAEYTYTSIGGEPVAIVGKDISGFTIASTNYGYDGLDHIYKPTFKFNNGTKDITLVEGTDFDFVYKRNGSVTSDFASKGIITVEAVGKGMYTGTTSGTYSIGSEYYHNPSLDVVLANGNYKWTNGATYQVIEADKALTNSSYTRIYFDAKINNWGTAIAGPVPAITVYFSYTNLGTTLSAWQSDGFENLEITEPGSYTIFYFFQVSDGLGWSAYKNAYFTVGFQKETADAPVTNATHTFDYDGSAKTFVTSYNSTQMDIRKVVYTAPDGKVTEYTGGSIATSYRNAGTYKIEFKTKTLYEFNLVSATESNTVYTVTYTINQRALNELTNYTGNSFTYKASAQGAEVLRTLTYSNNDKVITGQTIYVGLLYTGTDTAGEAYSSTDKPTNAGSYTLTITGIYNDEARTQKNTNYKFHASQTMSHNFTIEKAALTVNSPAISSGQTVYDGWNLSQITLDQNVKVTYGTNLNVAGNWVWVDPDTKIVKPAGTSFDANHRYTAPYAVKFVLTEDENNFVITDALNKNITLTINGLYVEVVEFLCDEYGNLVVGLGETRTFNIHVEYGATFDLDTYLADAGRSPQHGMVAELFDSGNEELDAIENITENKTGDNCVHIRFRKATDTVYYQLHLREHQDLTYATVSDVVNYLTSQNYVFNSYPTSGKTAITAENVATVNGLIEDYTELDCYIEVMTGTTGASVTCAAVADTSVSDGYVVGDPSSSAQISGEGTTIVSRQYSLKTYKLGFDANSGTIAVGLPQYDVKRNAHIPSDILPENSGFTPTKNGYVLLGWATEKTAAEPLDLAVFRMPASNTTLYAVWGPVKYTIQFNYTDYTMAGEQKLTDIAYDYFADMGPTELDQYIVKPYDTITDFAPVVNSMQLSEKPKYVGLTFKRWVYYVDGVATAINSLTATTLSKADLNPNNSYIYIYAEWMPASYTLTFNSNGTILSTRVSVTNFTSFADYTYPSATKRNGYTFCGWYTDVDRGGSFVVTDSLLSVNEEESPIDTVVLLANTTLYAGWVSNEYDLEIDTTNVNCDILVNGVEWNGGKVGTGDVLTITPIPMPGYEADVLRVCGIGCASGTYTVLSSYEDNVITITCDAIELTYKITYNLNGGAWTNNTYKAPSSFNIHNVIVESDLDRIVMPDASLLTRAGYTFGGWFITSASGELVGTAKTAVDDFFNPISDIADVKLTAKWTADLKVIHVYKNSDSIELDWNDVNRDDAKTGEVLELAIPIPNSYKLVGLATTSNGTVEYHAYEKEDEIYEENATHYMYVSYTVKSGENELYCKWIGSGNLFVQYKASADNYVYSATNNLTITATASKRYTDTSVQSIVYAFTWKKYNGSRFVTYSVQSSSEYSSTITLKNCSDSGIYRCELIVTVISKEGDDYNKIVEHATNTPENLGEVIPVGSDYDIDVTIAQATLYGIGLANETVSYNGTDLKSAVAVWSDGLGVLNDDATLLTFPDNSTADIVYYYFDADGIEVTEIINAGTYTVTAEFEMRKNGNFKFIEPLEATLTVAKKEITNITYSIAGLPQGTLIANYTGSPVTLVATSSDIVAKDTYNVTILLNNASNSTVGTHLATVAGLSGSASGNYELALTTSRSRCNYKIEAIKRVINVDFVGINADRIVEVTYDKNVHTISVGELPEAIRDQVEVVYSVEYTPAYAGYTAPASNIAVAKNGGTDAGTYVITATFLEKTGDYAPKDPITATLVIKQAAYTVDVEGIDGNNDSFIDNQYVPYSETVVHKPIIVNLKNDEVTAKYTYEKDNSIQGSNEASWVEIPATNGFTEAGDYRLTASLEYKTGFFNNNYAAIDDIVINFIIVGEGLTQLEIRYADPAKGLVGSYGGALDTKQFSIYAFFGTQEKLIYNSALTIYDMSSGSEVAFTKFDRADEEYPIRIKYFQLAVDCTVNVGPATYDVDVSFNNSTEVYSKDGHAPDLTVNYVKDVFGKDVSSVSFYFSLYNEKTATWGEYVPVSEFKLYNVGTYKVKLAYKHTDENYVGTNEFTDIEGEVTLTIDAKPVTDVTWQYSVGDEDVWADIPTGGLTYAATEFKFRALYDGATEDAVAPVALTATDVQENGYDLTAVSEDSNYALGTDNEGLTTNVMINPCEVTASWFIDGEPFDATQKQLVYDTSKVDQYNKISATYVNLAGQEVSLTVNKYKNQNGDEVALIDVRVYTMTIAEPDDTNYKVSEATKTQNITLYGKELDADLAWYEYSTDNGSTWTAIDGNELPYIAKTYKFRVCYYLSLDDKNAVDSDDLFKTGDWTLSGTNCGEYELTGGNQGSFYISKTLTVTIVPQTISVELSNPTFDGTEKSPQVTLNGVFGSLTVSDLLIIGGDLKARNVNAEGNYVMTVALNDSDAAKNYVLAEDSENVEWNITPKVAEFTWGKLQVDYTGSVVTPTVTLSNKAADDTDELELVLRGVESQISEGNDIRVEQILNADGTVNANYNLVDSTTRTTKYDIVPAKVTVTGVKYNEYATEGLTFVGTPLRNDKLTGDAFIIINGKNVPVAGKFAFKSTAAFTTTGFMDDVEYTFTPTDTHYAVYTGIVSLLVRSKLPIGIEINSNDATTTFVNSTAVGASDLADGLKIYQIYNNYYYDAILGEYRGTREELDSSALDGAEFSINNGATVITDADRYTFKKAGVYKVTVTLDRYSADYEITVTDYAVESISLNKNTKTTYYLTEKFDVSTISVNVKFKDELNVKVINSGITVKGKYATDAFTTVGTAEVTLDYGGAEFKVQVDVINREELNIVYTGRDIKYTGSVISIPNATLGGRELLHNTYFDVDGDGTNDVIAVYSIYSFTPKGSSQPSEETVYSMLEEGLYDIKVTLEVLNVKYNDHEAIIATFNVVDAEIEKQYQLKLIANSSYQITNYNNGLFLTHVVAGDTVDAIIGNFETTDGKIVITNAKGKEITGSTIVGTDYVITLVDENDQPIESVQKLTIVVKGDVNCDGRIAATDYTSLKNRVLGKKTFNDAQNLASDVNGDGRVAATDYTKLKNIVLGKSKMTW